MHAYILRRLALSILTVFLASLLIFFMVRLIPGDFVDALNAQSFGEEQVDRAEIEKAMGLDAPALVQYGRWLGVARQVDGSFDGLFQGNLGVSWWVGDPVTGLIRKKWPVTLQLSLMGLLTAQLIALPIGVWSALRQDKWGDYLGRTFAIFCISVPGFWLATMVIVFPSIWWHYMPPLMLIRFAKDPIGNLRMFIIPSILVGMALSGLTMRMTRTMMLDVLRQDCIRTAWAKGLGEHVVVVRHAVKNALIPVVTIVGLQLRVMIGGTVIIESIFSLPGMGRLLIDAVFHRDEPLITGVVLVFSVALVMINLLVDLTYAYLDPRIHYQ